MPQLPQLNGYSRQVLFTEQFTGYNHNRRISDGEMWDETNLCSDLFPMLATRKARSLVQTFEDPEGIMGKGSALVTLDSGRVYYGGVLIPDLLLSTRPEMQPKQIVAMGAYVCIWPDKVYFNTVDINEHGSMGASWDLSEGATVSISVCRLDGTTYSPSEYTVSSTPPTSPANGDLWIDTSNAVHVLKQYSSYTEEWVQVATVYSRISAPGIGQQYKQFDGVRISGLAGDPLIHSQALMDQINAFNGSKLIYARGDDWITVAGLIDQTVTLHGTVNVSRRVPDLDYVTESDNRIWGCKYGLVDGTTVNEIRCCALGDFRNWEKYQGISTDSYTASCGTDGKWTGAATLKGSPIFFKEGVLHRVTGYAPSNFQLNTTLCRGVQDGSWRSICVVGEALVYKGRTHVMLYDGSLPQEISYRLGEELYYEASAGAWGNYYYISMRDIHGVWHLFVYDTLHRTWHRQDNLHAHSFATVGDELYCLDADHNTLLALLGTTGTPEDISTVPFEAVFGTYGYETPNQKYLSQFVIRATLTEGSHVEVYFQYDSDGEWQKDGDMWGKTTATYNIPVMPRRCDHVQMKLKGTGLVRIISIGRTYKDGGRQYAARI